MQDLMLDALRITGLVVGGLVLYALVTLGILAFIGGRLKRLQSHRPTPDLLPHHGVESPQEVSLVS